MVTQTWTLKKAVYYLLYRLIAKHLPEDFGLIGKYSNNLRGILCRPLFKESAKIIRIGKGVDFDNGCTVIMKDHANIGSYTLIDGNHATVQIGKHVMMGKYCIIILQNHKYREDNYDGFVGKDIIIDDYAWLGHRVTLLPGVRIGKYAIVGAGSVVSKNIPNYAVAVGNPAIVKKFRKKVKVIE